MLLCRFFHGNQNGINMIIQPVIQIRNETFFISSNTPFFAWQDSTKKVILPPLEMYHFHNEFYILKNECYIQVTLMRPKSALSVARDSHSRRLYHEKEKTNQREKKEEKL